MKDKQKEALNWFVSDQLGLEDSPENEIHVPFRPSLNPIQGECYDQREATYKLYYGERGTGKTQGALHELVHASRENFNGLGLIITKIRRQGEEGGAWEKLIFQVLPEWKKGCGLEVSEVGKTDNKDKFIWIKNRFGSWSRILAISLFVDEHVADRVKGMEPNFVVVDEGQTFKNASVFRSLVQQIGRRPNITTKQQIIFCANPAGPSHWLYQRFFLYPVDNKQGKWNPQYFVRHIPLTDNEQNLPEGYWDNVLEACRGDEIEYRRMVKGEWVDRPEGIPLFAEFWDPKIHVRGNAARRQGIIPCTQFSIITGWDLGAAHSSVHFLQMIPTHTKIIWTIFDELVYVDRYVPYRLLVPRVLRRMDYWNARCNHSFTFEHISDDSAFNQFRAAQGSFDALDVKQISDGRIVLKAAPKGEGSKASRARIIREMLLQEEILVSDTCPKTKEVFGMLEEDPKNPGAAKRSRFIHPFDSFSYPIFRYSVFRNLRHGGEPEVEPIEPEIYYLGSAA